MVDPLYNRDILRLAASTAAFARLEGPDASAERRSPVCGSRVVIDLTFARDGGIARFGGEVRACAMGQASTALLAARAVGLSPDHLAEARDGLAALLAGKGRGDRLWPELSIFEPAITRTARHAAILLPFDAALAAALSFAKVS